MLSINLKNGTYIDIPKFEKVSVYVSGNLKVLTPENFSEFVIADSRTYVFEGSTTISINGSEILYIELNHSEK